MTISAKLVAYSLSRTGVTLPTFLLRYPRFIHPEFMTHRMFSRNASSSRAVPVGRLIEDVLRDTAMPIHWGANQPGMQAWEECSEKVLFEDGPDRVYLATREDAWLAARDQAVSMAKAFAAAGYHKQIVNRLLEPFAHINVVVTATEWDNFMMLRNHPDAQPEIHELARQMQFCLDSEDPVPLVHKHDVHTPFVTREDMEVIGDDPFVAMAVSAARCARTSYLTHDFKKPSIEQDLKLFARLVNRVPEHSSPLEHQAIPLINPVEGSGNFIGFRQFRKIIENYGGGPKFCVEMLGLEEK